jgi:hypothetical protein
MTKKIELGQFFTRKDIWLRPHIQNFIDTIKFNKIIDPFAGGGHLLKPFVPKYTVDGYDIDSTLTWPINDGLKGIPSHPNDLCVTNPPYLAKTTATRFKRTGTFQYFDLFPEFDDLYLMGLEQCFNSFPYGVALIPETYLLHSKKSKRLISATILEENPFEDTDFPIVIVIWGPDEQDDYDIYKNDTLLGTYNQLINKVPASTNLIKSDIKFNVTTGNLGIVCIDKGDNIGGIKFTTSDKITGAIKNSSRTSTKVMVPSTVDINKLIVSCNLILSKYREDTHDVFMAPFKGNDQTGHRRRRLDFTTARIIIEQGLKSIGYCVSNPELKTKLPKVKKQKPLNPVLFEES